MVNLEPLWKGTCILLYQKAKYFKSHTDSVLYLYASLRTSSFITAIPFVLGVVGKTLPDFASISSLYTLAVKL